MNKFIFLSLTLISTTAFAEYPYAYHCEGNGIDYMNRRGTLEVRSFQNAVLKLNDMIHENAKETVINANMKDPNSDFLTDFSERKSYLNGVDWEQHFTAVDEGIMAGTAQSGQISLNDIYFFDKSRKSFNVYGLNFICTKKN